MKKILLIALAFIATSPLFAQNFTTGGINYNIISDNSPYTTYVGVNTTFNGAATIPSQVINNLNNRTYAVIGIGSEAFTSTGITAISIPNSVTIIDDNAFKNCLSLTSINIPSSVTSIADDTFSGSGLTSIIIPNAVASIGGRAFLNCTSLTSVTIPSSVTFISGFVFAGCTSLSSVSVNWTTPYTINANVFQGVTLNNVTLNVPASTGALYDAAAVWTDFNPITAALSTNNFNANANINLYPNPSNGIFNFQLVNDLQIEVYNNLGQQLSSEKMFSGNNTINIANQAAGIYFLKANDGNNISTYKIIKN